MTIVVKELPPPIVRVIEQRMRPGRLSESGFLDNSERLIDVIDRDLELLAKVGITPKQVADRLETVVEQGFHVVNLVSRSFTKDNRGVPLDLYDTGVRIGPWELRGVSWHGSQVCPFVNADGVVCNCGSHASWDFSLTNIRTQKILTFPGLAIHLIREHHFFEGSVPHRVDPLVACEVLEVEKGKDYSPRWSTEHVWRSCFSTTETPEQWRSSGRDEHLLRVVDDPESTVPVGEDGHLYFRGDTCVAILAGDAWAPADLMVNGARWVEPQLCKGVSAFSHDECRYVEPEKLSECILENSGRSRVRSFLKSKRVNKRVGLPIRRFKPKARVRHAVSRLMGRVLSPFQRQVVDDATFGRLRRFTAVPEPGAPPSAYSSIWYGTWHFPPSGTNVSICLPGGRRGPLPAVRDFFEDLPNRFDSILSTIRPQLDEIFRRWLQRPLSESLWDDLELTRFIIVDPSVRPLEWNMQFELTYNEGDEEDEEGEYLEITVSLVGDSPQVAIVQLDTE